MPAHLGAKGQKKLLNVWRCRKNALSLPRQTKYNMTMDKVIKRNGLKMEADVVELAWQLKTYRIRSGLTQKQLAEKWGVSRYTLIRIEGGYEVGWPTMYKVASKLIQATREEGASV